MSFLKRKKKFRNILLPSKPVANWRSFCGADRKCVIFKLRSVWGSVKWGVSVATGVTQGLHKSLAKRGRAPKPVRARSVPGDYFETEARIVGKETGDSWWSCREVALMAFEGVSLIRMSHFPLTSASPCSWWWKIRSTNTRAVDGWPKSWPNPTLCFLCSSHSNTKRSCYWNSPQQSIKTTFTMENSASPQNKPLKDLRM